MNVAVRVLVVAVVAPFLGGAELFARGVTLEQACIEVFQQGKTGDALGTVNVGKHGFKIVPADVVREGDTITVTGKFFHLVKGGDDKVFFTIVAKKGGTFTATIESIEYRGLFGGGKINKVIQWTGRVGGGLGGAILKGPAGAVPGVGVGEKIANYLVKGLNAIQRKLIGKWEPAAAEILNGMGDYFARQK